MTALAAAVVLIQVLGAQEAVADKAAPTPAQMDEAADRFQRAAEMFEESNFSGALAEFRRAQALAPSYRLLYNIGQVCYMLRDYPCALDSFSKYLSQGGGEIPAARRAEVQRDLERLRGRVGRLRIVCNHPGAEVAVDDVVLGKMPLSEPLLVAAGQPRVTVTLAGYAPANKVVEVAAMETVTVEMPLQPLTTSAPAAAALNLSARLPAPPPPAATPRRTAPFVSWVITGALAAAAAASGGLALWSSSDLKHRREQWVVDSGDLHRRSTRVKRLALVTDVLIGGALMAAGVSTLITLTGPPDSRQLALLCRF